MPPGISEFQQRQRLGRMVFRLGVGKDADLAGEAAAPRTRGIHGLGAGAGRGVDTSSLSCCIDAMAKWEAYVGRVEEQQFDSIGRLRLVLDSAILRDGSIIATCEGLLPGLHVGRTVP